jgi:NAD(P)H-flavin reductase
MSNRFPDPMLSSPFSVQRVRQETHDTFTLELKPANGNGQFSFKPGQFNMIYVFGIGEVPISISGDPNTVKTLIHTTRAVGTVTKAMRMLKPGHILGIRGPYGSPWPVEKAVGSDVVIVAGGIGLAPLRPAMYRLIAERQKYGRVVLLYGARTPEEILFGRELEQWRAHLDLEVYVTVDRAMGGWRGNVGFVTTLVSKAPFDPLNSVAMVCGPEVMMRFAVMELQKRGVKGDKIYISMERNMKCAVGFCGHCQFGPFFVCKDGPVFAFDRVKDLLAKWEI